MNYNLYKASSFTYTPFNNFGEGDLDCLVINNVIIVISRMNLWVEIISSVN